MRLERDNEFIRLGQTYVESNGTDEGLKSRLIEVASSMESLSMPMIIDNLKKAVEDNTEKAVSHDADLINDPETLDAFHKYASSIRFYVNELDLPIVFKALTLTENIPEYEETAEASLIVAKEYVKKIVDETHCKASTTRFLAIELAFYVCELSYSIYHRSEFETRNIAVENLSDKIMEITNADIERDKYIEQRSLLYSELEDVNYNYAKGVYKFDQSLQIVNEWIAELYPEEEIPDSEQTTKRRHENSIAKTVHVLDNIIPSKYFIANNKLSNTLTKEGVELDMELDLILNDKKEVVTKVYLNYDDENITIYDEGKKFTPYDRTVINAACSIYEAGNTNFTAKQVYRCMNGLSDTQDVSPQAVGAITKSLDKARRTYVKIDCTQEAASYKNNTDFKCEIEDYILSAKKVTLTSGKEEVVGYALNSKPILYEYAQMSNQVLSVDSKLLNTKDVIRSTPEVIVIRELLIRRIEVMKNPKNKLGNKIALSKIYEEIGQSEPTKEKANKVRTSVEKILGKYKKEGYIKDFEFYKEGRAFKGVQIKY